MAKLEIIFKNENTGWRNPEKTELAINVEGNAVLYIGTKEKRTLKELAEGVERDLRKRKLLKDVQKIELNRLDQEIIEYEENAKRKVNAKIYNILRMSYEAVEDGSTTWQELIDLLNESRCS